MRNGIRRPRRDNAYAVMVDNDEADGDIADITDPRKPSLISEYDPRPLRPLRPLRPHSPPLATWRAFPSRHGCEANRRAFDKYILTADEKFSPRLCSLRKPEGSGDLSVHEVSTSLINPSTSSTGKSSKSGSASTRVVSTFGGSELFYTTARSTSR